MYAQDNQPGNITKSIERVRRVVEPQTKLWQETYDTVYQAWINYQRQIDRLTELSDKIAAPPPAAARIASPQKQMPSSRKR